MLGHFSNHVGTSIDDNIEPLYQNLFEISFNFPEILGLTEEDQTTMMINARNINLNLTEDLNVETQFFKYSGRQYLSTNRDNSIISDMSINFNINVDNSNAIRTWNYLKKWYDLAWNSQTGELHYKREMIGTIVAQIHDRQGIVVRRVEFRNVQLKGLGGMEFNWENEGIIDGTVNFISDYWIDLYADIE